MAIATERRQFAVVDPADGSVIETLESALPEDGIVAVDAAEAAAADWAARAPRERAEILRRAFDLMTARSEEVAQLIVREMGKPLEQADAPLKFGPEEGPDFFKPYGWRLIEAHSMFHTAGRLKRLPLLFSIFYHLHKSEAFQAKRPWSGACLFEKVGK